MLQHSLTLAKHPPPQPLFDLKIEPRLFSGSARLRLVAGPLAGLPRRSAQDADIHAAAPGSPKKGIEERCVNCVRG
jgi:hypothetical protein